MWEFHFSCIRKFSNKNFKRFSRKTKNIFALKMQRNFPLVMVSRFFVYILCNIAHLFADTYQAIDK